MAVEALFQFLAALSVARYKSAGLPIIAQFKLILKEIRPAPEVLVVMRVEALSLVVLMIKRTPLGLEIIYVKLKIVLCT